MELISYNTLCSIHFSNNRVETFHKISKQWNEIVVNSGSKSHQ